MNNPQSTDLYGRVMLSIEGTSLLSHEKDLISNPCLLYTSDAADE